MTVLVAFLLAFSGCQDESVTKPAPPDPDLSVTPQAAELVVGDSVQLSVVEITGFTNPTITSWESEGPNIATVIATPGDSTAWVFGESPGEVVVTVTVEGDNNSASAASKVTVVPDTTGGS